MERITASWKSIGGWGWYAKCEGWAEKERTEEGDIARVRREESPKDWEDSAWGGGGGDAARSTSPAERSCTLAVDKDSGDALPAPVRAPSATVGGDDAALPATDTDNDVGADEATLAPED